jgi:hypothetical protein
MPKEKAVVEALQPPLKRLQGILKVTASFHIHSTAKLRQAEESSSQ